MEKSSTCLKLSYWLQSWKSRVCALNGSIIYLAKKEGLPAHDAIDLLESNVSVSLQFFKGFEHIEIVGLNKSKYHCYKLNFGKGNEEWYKCLTKIVRLGQLEKPVAFEVVHFAFKYIGLSLAMDWLTLKDLIGIDSAVCNRNYRRLFLGLLTDFGSKLSRKFLNFSIILDTKTANWLIQRSLTVSNIDISDVQLLNVLLRKQLYDFSSVLELSFGMDSDQLYELLRQCPSLKCLRVYAINNKARFLSSLVVHNRKLQRLNWHYTVYSNRTLLLFVLHHRNLSIFSKLECPFFVFKTGVWHQNAPDSVFMHTQTQQQISELCAATTGIKTLTDPMSVEGASSQLLSTQPYLARVTLGLDGTSVSGFPMLLSRCSSITYLDLTRRNSKIPLDWSCLEDSSMRIHTLHLFLEYEDVLRYCCKILSEAEVLTFSNHKVVDYQLAGIFLANHNHFTELNIYSAHGLTEDCFHYLSSQGKNLKRIRIPLDSNKWRTCTSFDVYALMGSTHLRCLIIPSSLLSLEVLPSLALRFPSLRHLFLNCTNPDSNVLKRLLDLLGKRLIDLGLDFCSECVKSDVVKHASSIERCCEIL